MSIHDVSKEEKIQLLESWKRHAQEDVDGYQILVDEQLAKKQVLEEKLSKRLRPVLKKISIFQGFVNSFVNKVNEIEKQIENVKNETDD